MINQDKTLKTFILGTYKTTVYNSVAIRKRQYGDQETYSVYDGERFVASADTFREAKKLGNEIIAECNGKEIVKKL